MTPTDAMIDELLTDLDLFARAASPAQCGLPIYWKQWHAMRELVRVWLRKQAL